MHQGGQQILRSTNPRDWALPGSPRIYWAGQGVREHSNFGLQLATLGNLKIFMRGMSTTNGMTMT